MFTVALLSLCAVPQPAVESDTRPRDVLLAKLETARDSGIKQIYIRAMALLQRPDCEPTLRKYLKDDDKIVQFNSMTGLLLLGKYDSSIKQVLLDTTRSKDMTSFLLTLKYEDFKQSGHDYTKPATDLISSLGDENQDISISALTHLWALNCRDKEAVPALIKVLRLTDDRRHTDFKKSQACWILMSIGKEAGDARSALEDLLKHSNHQLSGSAAVALLQQDPSHGEAMRHLHDALFGLDESRARITASMFLMVPGSSTALSSLLHEPGHLDFKTNEGGYLIARAVAEAGLKHKAIEDWLIRSLRADSLRLRMDASIALSTLYPEHRGKVIDNVRLAFAGESFDGADLLAEHLATVDHLPKGIVDIARENYVRLNRVSAPALALVVLKANPEDADAEAFIRNRLVYGVPNIPGGFVPDYGLARASAAVLVGKAGKTGLRFRGELIAMLEEASEYQLFAAARAIHRLDSLATRKP